MANPRISFTINEAIRTWLGEKSLETGASKGGVMRTLILKQMIREETKNGKKVNPRRSNK